MEDIGKNMARKIAAAADARSGLAHTMFRSLKAKIQDFESRLSEGQEVAAWLANFGSTTLITVESVGYRNPHLIVLTGFAENGEGVELLQHVSQVNLLLKAVPAKGVVHRIGFDPPAPESTSQ